MSSESTQGLPQAAQEAADRAVADGDEAIRAADGLEQRVVKVADEAAQAAQRAASEAEQVLHGGLGGELEANAAAARAMELAAEAQNQAVEAAQQQAERAMAIATEQMHEPQADLDDVQS
jgi:hypothetical protein